MSRPRRKAPRKAERARTLLFIALCFAGSAAARMGDVGAAFAQGAPTPFEPTVLPDQPATATPEAAARQPRDEDGYRPRAAASCEGETQLLLEAIRERDAALAAREAALAEREGKLALAQERVRAEIARMEEVEAALAATLARADVAAEEDVTHVVGVYEAMKPKDAAGVFGEMAPNFAAGILARMNRDTAGSIIAAMEPNAAYAVTAIMAGRNVNAGRAPAD